MGVEGVQDPMAGGVPFRPNPLTPFPAREGGKFGGAVEEVTPQHSGKPLAHEGEKRGVQGGEAPMAGAVGGAPPQNLKRYELPTLATPPRVGPKTLANPKPTGVGKRGVEGAKPHPRGFGGCAPKNIKIRGELPTLAAPPRVGPKVLANPEPTGVGKRGSRGAKPHGRGHGGCPPTKP
jgi:hypothetical protein